MNKLIIVAAAAVLAGGGQARAESGILVCEMSVGAFAADAARATLSPDQRAAARQLVEIGRGQCRSSTDVVEANIRSMRRAFAIAPGPQSAERSDDFWPASREELSALEPDAIRSNRSAVRPDG